MAATYTESFLLHLGAVKMRFPFLKIRKVSGLVCEAMLLTFLFLYSKSESKSDVSLKDASHKQESHDQKTFQVSSYIISTHTAKAQLPAAAIFHFDFEFPACIHFTPTLLVRFVEKNITYGLITINAP